MNRSKGEIIDKPPSKFGTFAIHTSGLIGMVFNLVWIILVLVWSYFEPFKLGIFLDSWYSIGIYLVLISAGVELILNLLKFYFGKIQILEIGSVIKALVTAATTYGLYVIYPFDFGDWNSIIPAVLIFIIIASILDAVNHGSKFYSWDNSEKRSFTA